MRIGASRSRAPRRTSSRPHGTPSSRSRCWQWLMSRIPLRAAMPKTVKNPTSEPSVMTPPVGPGGEHAADQRHRQGEEHQQGQPPAGRTTACSSSRTATPASTGGEQQLPVLGGLPLLVLPEHLGVVAERERDRLRASPRARVTTDPGRAPRRRRPRRAGGVALPLDAFGRRCRSRTVATSARRTRLAGRRVDRQALDRAHAVARLVGVLHTTTSYALPPRKMSPTSSPATSVRRRPGARRRA